MQSVDTYMPKFEHIRPVSVTHIMMMLCRHYPFPRLERVILASNEIDSIAPPAHNSLILKKLEHISLSSNNLKSWNDLDALSIWCPSLTSLSVIGNPLVESELEHFQSRMCRLITNYLPNRS